MVPWLPYSYFCIIYINILILVFVGTPLLVLLTKIDQLGIGHIEQMFYDKRVQECCEKVSSFLGFSLGDVLPQANYCKDVIPSEPRDCITLFNIWKIMETAKDHVQRTSTMTENEWENH